MAWKMPGRMMEYRCEGSPLKFWRDVRTLYEDGADDDQHPDECESRSTGQLVNVTVQGQRVRDAERAEADNELPVCQDAKKGHRLEHGEGRSNDMRYGVANDDSEGAHAFGIKC